MFPLPNFVDPNLATRYNWNYYVAASEPYNRRTETARIDYSPKENWQLYLSLSNNADHQNVPYSGGTAGWVAGSLNFVMSPIAYSQPGRLATLHSTNTISPTLFNEASFAVSQNTLNYAPEFPDLVDRTKLGINIPQRNPALNPLNMIPDMSFSSIQNYANPSMSDGTPYFNQNTIYSFIDNVSKIHGSHVFKAGIYFEQTQKIQSAGPPIRGNISFNTDTQQSVRLEQLLRQRVARQLRQLLGSAAAPAIGLPFHQHGMVHPGRLEGEERPVDQLRAPLLSRSAAV